jgi:hypothetical protein
MSIIDKYKENIKIHSIENCPQAPVLAEHGFQMERHGEILDRLERHSERQTTALEQIAEQGAIVKSHEKRLDEHREEIDIIFNKHRKLDDRVQGLEKINAESIGEKRAERRFEKRTTEDGKRLWTFLERLQLVTPILLVIGGILVVCDKFDVFQKIHNFIVLLNK